MKETRKERECKIIRNRFFAGVKTSKLHKRPRKVLKPESIPFKENCAICLDKITERGLSPRCDHHFCFVCILQWSKMSNSCPICKREFKLISKTVKSPHQRVTVLEKVSIPRRKQKNDEMAEEDLLRMQYEFGEESSDDFLVADEDALSVASDDELSILEKNLTLHRKRRKLKHKRNKAPEVISDQEEEVETEGSVEEIVEVEQVSEEVVEAIDEVIEAVDEVIETKEDPKITYNNKKVAAHRVSSRARVKYNFRRRINRPNYCDYSE